MSRFGSAVRHEAGEQTVLIDPSVCMQQKHFSASDVEQESASVYRYGQDNRVNPAQRNVGTFSLFSGQHAPILVVSFTINISFGHGRVYTRLMFSSVFLIYLLFLFLFFFFFLSVYIPSTID